MSSEGTPKTRPNLSSIATMIAAVVIILGALYISFKGPLDRLFRRVTASLVSADTGVPAGSSAVIELAATPQAALSAAAQAVDQYYRYINTAPGSDDLDKAWSMLTINSKCNTSDRCNFARYQMFWWESKVKYKLYDCGSNTIEAELTYYARKSAGPTASAKTERIRYELIQEDGQLKLNSAEALDVIGADCKLAVPAP